MQNPTPPSPTADHLPLLFSLFFRIEDELERRKVAIDKAAPQIELNTAGKVLNGKRLSDPEKRTGLEWRLECDVEGARSYVNVSFTVDGHPTVRLLFSVASLETEPRKNNRWDLPFTDRNFEILLAHEAESLPEFREVYHRKIPNLPKAGDGQDSEVTILLEDAFRALNAMIELYWYPHASRA